MTPGVGNGEVKYWDYNLVAIKMLINGVAAMTGLGAVTLSQR